MGSPKGGRKRSRDRYFFISCDFMLHIRSLAFRGREMHTEARARRALSMGSPKDGGRKTDEAWRGRRIELTAGDAKMKFIFASRPEQRTDKRTDERECRGHPHSRSMAMSTINKTWRKEKHEFIVAYPDQGGHMDLPIWVSPR